MTNEKTEVHSDQVACPKLHISLAKDWNLDAYLTRSGSTWVLYRNPLEGLLKQFTCLTLWISDSVGLEWGLEGLHF